MKLTSTVLTLATLAAALILMPSRALNAQDDGGNVSVTHSDLVSGTDVYGARFYLTNGRNETVCVTPYLAQGSYNVTGGVGSIYELTPGESNLNIGQYNRADDNQAWAAYVGAKWKSGTC